MDSDEQNRYDLAIERMQYQRELNEAKQAESNSQAQAKMGWGIFLVGIFLSLIADILEILVVFFPLVFIIDIILGFMFGFSKGARKQWKKWIAGFLPIPLLRVALLIWSFISSRNAKLQTISGLASRVIPKT